MTSLSGGQAARAALAALLLSRFDVVLLDEPTNDLDLDGLDAAGGVRAAGCAAASCWSPTTASSWPAASPASSSWTSRRTRSPSTTAATTRSWRSARSPAGTRGRRTTSSPTRRPTWSARARTQREWSSQGVRNAMKKSPDNDKIRRRAQHRVVREAGAEGAPDGIADRPARGGRGAPQGVGSCSSRIGAAPRSSSVRRHARTEAVVRRGDFALGPGLAAGQRGRADRHHRPQRRRQVHAAAAAARADEARRGHARAWAPASRSARSTRPAAGFDEALPLGDAFEAAVPEMTARRACAPCWRSSGCKADQVTSRGRAASRPASGPAPALALLQARGVNLLVLDEPTNHLDLPAIEQLEQALESYDGALLLVSHDRRLLENVRLDARWKVSRGQVLLG